MKILNLTLKKKWFDMIALSRKKEEYREVKPYWTKRLWSIDNKYDAVLFRNGYSPDSPKILLEYKGIIKTLGIIEWGAPENEIVYVIKLGKILPLEV